MIDAAFTDGDGRTYIFSGKWYISSSNDTVSKPDMIFTRRWEAGPDYTLSSRWKNLPKAFREGIDAAVYHNGQTYFFKDNLYTSSRDFESKTLPGVWKNMPQEFQKGIDAAVRHDDRTYFFCGNRYAVVKSGTWEFVEPGTFERGPAFTSEIKGVDTAFGLGDITHLISGVNCHMYKVGRSIQSRSGRRRIDQLFVGAGSANIPERFTQPSIVLVASVLRGGELEVREDNSSARYLWPGPGTANFYSYRGNAKGKLTESGDQIFNLKESERITLWCQTGLTIEKVSIFESIKDPDHEDKRIKGAPIKEVTPGNSLRYPNDDDPEALISCTNLSAKIEHTHTGSPWEAKFFFGIDFKSSVSTTWPRVSADGKVYPWDPEVRDQTGN